jgi:hypothetical protein
LVFHCGQKMKYVPADRGYSVHSAVFNVTPLPHHDGDQIFN